jgi:hypothetical protein
MLEEMIAEGPCPPWVTGDEVYGRDAKLRAFLEARRVGYVPGVPCSFRITLPTGQKLRGDHTARMIPAQAWQTASAGDLAGNMGRGVLANLHPPRRPPRLRPQESNPRLSRWRAVPGLPHHRRPVRAGRHRGRPWPAIKIRPQT